MASSLSTRSNREVDLLGLRERQFASLIWRKGPLSRREIQHLTGVHPTSTGASVGALIEAGLMREGQVAPALSRGRPQVPIEIDPHRRCFLGLSIAPGMVRAVRVSPTGQPLEEEQIENVTRRRNIIDAARALLDSKLSSSVHGIGVSFTGLADPIERKLLFSSSLPTNRGVSLQPIYDAAEGVPIVLDNDMHALSMRWLLTHEHSRGDLLLVGLGDGRLGASLLFDGQPHRGSVSAANELGHTRLAVETDSCFCGQVGCLERIVSSAQLARFGAKSGRSLEQLLIDAGRESAVIDRMLTYLVTGLSNAVNFVRPRTVVIAGPLAQYPKLQEFVRDALPPCLLPGFRERTELKFWERSTIQSAENAAWLALADLFGTSPATGANVS